MATKTKSEAQPIKSIYPVSAVIKKHPDIKHGAPIKVSEYRGSDGVARFIRFSEKDPEFKQYGGETFSIIVRDSGVFLEIEKNPIDALKYRHLKEMQRLGIYPFIPAKPILFIVEPEVEDETEVKAFDRQFKAMKILNEELSDPYDKREFAHYFGEHEGTDNRVFLNLKKRADKSPEEFISAWEDPLRQIFILVRKSIDKGLISLKGETGVYFFGETALGFNYGEIVNSFAKDEMLTTILSKRLAE